MMPEETSMTETTVSVLLRGVVKRPRKKVKRLIISLRNKRNYF